MTEESDPCEDGHEWVEYEGEAVDYYCDVCGVGYED